MKAGLLRFATITASFIVAMSLASIAHVARCDEPISTGAIQGGLADSHEQSSHPGKAVVFLCDEKSGLPLLEHKNSDGPGYARYLDFEHFNHAVTDSNGGFEFTRVPPGEYRLVAQAWSGITGTPRGIVGSLPTDPGVEPSSIVILWGTADSVEVKAGKATVAFTKQLGMSAFHLTTDPECPHNYIVLSRNAPLGDPILGPVGWGQDFISGIVSITRAEDANVTFIGLPEGSPIHVGLFNYDNAAGVGGGSYIVKSDHPAIVPVYATWSDGKRDPPPQLVKLTEHLTRNKVDIPNLTGLGAPAETSEYIHLVWKKARDTVELSGYGKTTVIELLAADAYRQIHSDYDFLHLKAGN